MVSKHLSSPSQIDSTDSIDAASPAHAEATLPHASDTPLLDPAALARLAELDPTGKSHLLERVLQAFQHSVARLRPQVDAARLVDDRTAIRLVAHTLKSSSASIGAHHLSQLCAQIETAVRLESAADLSGPLNALDDALDNALLAIDTLLKERA